MSDDVPIPCTDLRGCRLVLASSSPRRTQLLREAGYRFEIIPPNYDEPAYDRATLSPPQRAEALSFFKAASVTAVVGSGLILGADTLVARDGHVFGKPHDATDARRILSHLLGVQQDVITAVTLIDTDTGERLIRHDVTRVTMRAISDAELEDYIASGDWYGKAGAYGIQDVGDDFVERIDGSFSNVVGLPLELVADMLAELIENKFGA